MEKLTRLACKYRDVKNYIYQRYGGVHSLDKITPGYAVLKELNAEGYREKIGLPTVYFQNAVYDALGDIRGAWGKWRGRTQKSISTNEILTDADKHYLRYLLSVDKAFSAVLENRQIKLSDKLMRSFNEAAEKVDTRRLDNYLRRHLRKHHKILHTNVDNCFSLDYRGYRYMDHGIYLASIEKMKRIFIPLTDTVQTERQINVKLDPSEFALEILVPIDVKVHRHEDYINEVGVAFGIHTMLTADSGNEYGKDYSDLQLEYSTWLREANRKYSINRHANAGRKKYENKKNRMLERIRSYINLELQRFIEIERPSVVYVPKLPPYKARSHNKEINYRMTAWQKRMITDNLVRKCQNNSVEVMWINPKGLGKTCSQCKAEWETTASARQISKEGKITGWLRCPACGFEIEEMKNTAINARSRGQQ